MCCAIMLIALSRLMESLIETRSSSWNASNHSPSASFSAVVEEVLDAMDQPREDVCDVLGPGLPVFPVAALLERSWRRSPRAADRAAGRAALDAWRVLAVGIAAAEDHSIRRLPVEVDLVDLGIEPVVVGAKRAEHAPHGGEALVVVERGGWFYPRGHSDWEDDVAIFLAFGFPHCAADGLDDVDLAVPGAHEEHGVERRDVDAFGEATRVRENAASAPGRALQPLDLGLSVERVVLPVDMAGLTTESRGLLPCGQQGDSLAHDAVPVRLEPLGGVDGVGERDRARKGTDRAIPGGLVLGVLERAPAADDFRCVGEINLPAAGGEVSLEGTVHVTLGHGEDDDPVVGQQVLLDCP